MIEETLKLDSATERVAVNVLRHLEWQPQGFSLVFLFADVGPGLSLANWLDQRLLSQGTPLERHDTPVDFVSHPQSFVDEVVGDPHKEGTPKGALWLWMHLHPTDQQWNQARRVFLARLNERRYLLERDFGRPLVLVMPVPFKADARAIAPDLWAVRAVTEELRAAPIVALVASAQASFPSPEATSFGTVGEPTILRAYNEWRNAVATAPERAYLATATAAVDELVAVGRPADAMVVAKESVELARKRSRDSKNELEGSREISIALNNVARVAQVQGNWTQVESLYRESLGVRRQLLERLGATPQALRDVSISLNNVAGVAQVQGNWTEAESLYRESLGLVRQLLERLGGTPEALRDVSISLNNVARVAQAQGNWTEAESLYRESLGVRRQLVERLGGTSEALRDISVSLNNVARVAQAQGNWTEAESLYRESLGARRQLVERLGGTPETQRDVSISLDNVARVTQAQGNGTEAESLYRESLGIRRQLVERLGGTPEALRDLSVSLDNVAGVAQAQGNWTEAESLYRESLGVRRQLLERLGGTPEAWDDLGTSLVNVGSLPEKSDDSLLREALQIYQRLTTICPSVAGYQQRLAQVRGLLEK